MSEKRFGGYINGTQAIRCLGKRERTAKTLLLRVTRLVRFPGQFPHLLRMFFGTQRRIQCLDAGS